MGILRISAKCSDLCWSEYTDKNGNKTESDNYVPSNIGIGGQISGQGGDFIDIDIDMETGQIQNWKPISDAKVIEAQKNA